MRISIKMACARIVSRYNIDDILMTNLNLVISEHFDLIYIFMILCFLIFTCNNYLIR